MAIWYTHNPDATTHWVTGDPTVLVSGSGTLYFVLGSNTGWADPIAAEIKLGHLSGGGPAVASGAVASPGVDTDPFDWPSIVSSLAAGDYRIAYVWSDGSGDSPVVVTGVITVGAGRLKVWTGAAWAVKPAKVWDGAAWVVKPVKIYSGASWV